MKRVLFVVPALVVTLVLVYAAPARISKAHPSNQDTASPQASAACTPPTVVGSSPEQTAWQLFVAATCPVNSNKYPYVTWQNWIEQEQLYTPSGEIKALAEGERPRFHMSPLARIMQERRAPKGKKKGLPQVANQDCNSQTWSKRTICEEARLNLSAQTYISSNKLTTLAGQEAFVAAGNTFQFPAPGVEIKADWIQLTTCNNPPQGVHVEAITAGGKTTCYALGGIHLISKLIDNWIWATFEPQNATTNPQRCVVLGCKDPYGSNPPTSKGARTQLTAALANLMKQANLAPEWLNYRLDGVQTDFGTKPKPTLLGNSIIEGDNAGNPTLMKSSSCITCHDLSTINAQGQHLPINFIVGPPAKLPPGYVPRDFVWSLLLAQ